VAFHAEQRLYYKEFLPRGPFERLKALARGSRGRRARRNGDALRLAGFDAPANLAWGHLPGGREYLITAALPGRGIADWLCGPLAAGDAESLRRRRQLLRALGTFIGRLHAAGFIHGDLRPNNVLAALGEGAFRFALIDNERNVHRRLTPKKRLLKNLMQLNMLPPPALSRADRMRFFLRWRDEMTALPPPEAKMLGAQAWLWAMQRLRAKGRL
jgi:hypothetical protein